MAVIVWGAGFHQGSQEPQVPVGPQGHLGMRVGGWALGESPGPPPAPIERPRFHLFVTWASLKSAKARAARNQSPAVKPGPQRDWHPRGQGLGSLLAWGPGLGAAARALRRPHARRDHRGHQRATEARPSQCWAAGDQLPMARGHAPGWAGVCKCACVSMGEGMYVYM